VLGEAAIMTEVLEKKAGKLGYALSRFRSCTK